MWKDRKISKRMRACVDKLDGGDMETIMYRVGDERLKIFFKILFSIRLVNFDI